MVVVTDSWVCFQEVVQQVLPGATVTAPDGSLMSMTTTILEVPKTVVTALNTMMQSSQPQTAVKGDVVVMNGLTTSQVIREDNIKGNISLVISRVVAVVYTDMCTCLDAPIRYQSILRLKTCFVNYHFEGRIVNQCILFIRLLQVCRLWVSHSHYEI